MKKLYVTLRHDGLIYGETSQPATCRLTNRIIQELFKKTSCNVTVLGHPEDMWLMADTPHPFIRLMESPIPLPRGTALLGGGGSEIKVVFLPCDMALPEEMMDHGMAMGTDWWVEHSKPGKWAHGMGDPE
jgi:hypothetical protein